MKYQIELGTYNSIVEFVNTVSKLKGEILVKSGKFCGNGKSLLNMLATVEWNDLWVESDNDIYTHIQKFIKE